MNIDEIKKLAEEIGFSHVGKVNMDALTPMEAVRDMCADGKCERYGTNWGCPPSPLCCTIDEAYDQMHKYDGGVVCQYTADMEDQFDLKVIKATSDVHKSMFDTLVRQLRIMGVDNMPLGSGSCMRCHKCTYPDRPCRYPDKLYPSMEAYGLWVSDVCTKSGLQYNYGEKTITYTACVLIKGE